MMPVNAVLLLATLGVLPQAAVDLSWKLPHDRAAAYTVFDSARGVAKNEFWLLGCELESGRIGAIQGSDLPYRYLFRLPKDPVKVGDVWPVKETAFGEMRVVLAPLEITGAYRCKQIGSIKLGEYFKAALKGKKTGWVDAAVIEGRFEVRRCNWVNEKIVVADQKPSATLTTVVIARLSDGAILGARYAWRGRVENFAPLSGPMTSKVELGEEMVLREPYVELSRTALQDGINKAIEDGSKWLRSQQGPDGAIFDRKGYPIGTSAGVGATALALAALLHSGVSAEDDVVKRGFRYVFSKQVVQSYDAALILMALEAKYLSVANMDVSGTLSEDAARAAVAKAISAEDKTKAMEMAQLLMDCQGKHGAFGYTVGSSESNLSNTQYALLGLKAASRLGMRVPLSAWRNALVVIHSAMRTDGRTRSLTVDWRGGEQGRYEVTAYRWVYGLPNTDSGPDYGMVPTDTMTTAALSSLAICRDELGQRSEVSELCEKDVQDAELGGWGWVEQHYGLRAGWPEGAWWGCSMVYYYLYGLERAGILTGVERVGGHDWYVEGAALLLSWQESNGRWESVHAVPVVDTSYALLFLKRATLPLATPTWRGGTQAEERKPQ